MSSYERVYQLKNNYTSYEDLLPPMIAALWEGKIFSLRLICHENLRFNPSKFFLFIHFLTNSQLSIYKREAP